MGKDAHMLNPMARCLSCIRKVVAVINLAEAKRISPDPLRQIPTIPIGAVEEVATVAKTLVVDLGKRKNVADIANTPKQQATTPKP